MAMSGPPPKPTRLKQIAGNPGKRKLNTKEPSFNQTNKAQPPVTLQPEAKRVWAKIVAQLEATGLLAHVDTEILAGYCVAWAHYVDAIKFIEKHGQTFKTLTNNGSECIKEYPQVAIARNNLLMMDRLAGKFGLTPADRARLHMPDAPIEDAVEDIFRRRRG